MRFVIDQQLPPLLAHWLREQGLNAAHVRELGYKDVPDPAIWRAAMVDGAVVVSKDEDFVRLLRFCGKARLVWIRLGNCPNPVLMARITERWPEVLGRLRLGEALVELN